MGELLNAVSHWSEPQVLLVGWPQRASTWREGGVPAQKEVLEFVRALLENTTSVRVAIVVGEQFAAFREQQVCRNNAWSGRFVDDGRLSFVFIPMDDCWLRDTGPVFLAERAGAGVGVCFRFNAWGGANGGCYVDFEKDDKVADALCARYQKRARHVDMILEGGSISSDGYGTILTTEECLLHANRNPDMNRREIERKLREHIGATNIIWLPYGIAHDVDTNGHVDNMAVFLARNHVLLSWASVDEDAEQHRRCAAALRVLQSSVDAYGERLRVHLVHIPSPPRARRCLEAIATSSNYATGTRVAAAYVNVVVTKEVVFAPAFADPDVAAEVAADARALRELRAAVDAAASDQTVVMVNARELILGGGGLHCITLDIPAS